MIDKLMEAMFNQAVRDSRRKGTALIEELDKRHLLATHEETEDLGSARVRGLMAVLDSFTAADLMKQHYGRAHGTPEEMFAAIMAYIHGWADIHARVVTKR